jgi:hypothetical protein
MTKKVKPNDLINKTVQHLKEIEGDTIQEARELKKRAQTFEKYKKAYILEVKGRREKNAQKPVTYNGFKFDADIQSQQKIQGAIQLAKQYNAKNSDTWSTDWKLADNSFTEVNKSDLESIFGLIGDQVQKSYSQESTFLQKIESAKTINELNKIDLTSGWP